VIARHGLRGAVRGFGFALIASVAVACAPSGPLHVDNATDIAVGVYADGRWVATYAPGASGDASITGAGRPQALEVRSASGAVLLSLPINDDQLAAGGAGGYGNGASIGLPCGVVTVLIGRLGATEALAPAASVEPGPCP
jgi:hypothetical protein